MNAEKPPAAWWSWAPRFPRWAIIIAAVVFDLILVGTARYNYLAIGDAQITTLPLFVEAIIDRSVAGNAVALLMFLQLNLEVLHMIFSLKANWSDVQAAKAKGKAEGITQGQAATEARFREWYEANADKLSDASPPPFSGNGNSNGAGS